MARKKEPPKPLLTFKHDFYASLDEALQRGLNLIQVVEQVLGHDLIKNPEIKKMLVDAVAKYKAAVFETGVDDGR